MKQRPCWSYKLVLWEHVCNFIRRKESAYIRKSSTPTGLAWTPIWPPLHCLGNQNGRLDVMWKRSIALKCRIDLFSLYDLFCEWGFQGITPLSFHRSCEQMHGNKIEFEWSSSVGYYHMTYTGKANIIHDRWLLRVFQGQYLPSFSINYVAINKRLKKLPPQLY